MAFKASMMRYFVFLIRFTSTCNFHASPCFYAHIPASQAQARKHKSSDPQISVFLALVRTLSPPWLQHRQWSSAFSLLNTMRASTHAMNIQRHQNEISPSFTYGVCHSKTTLYRSVLLCIVQPSPPLPPPFYFLFQDITIWDAFLAQDDYPRTEGSSIHEHISFANRFFVARKLLFPWLILSMRCARRERIWEMRAHGTTKLRLSSRLLVILCAFECAWEQRRKTRHCTCVLSRGTL